MNKKLLPKFIISCQVKPWDVFYNKKHIENLITTCGKLTLPIIRVKFNYVNFAKKFGIKSIAVEKTNTKERFINTTYSSINKSLLCKPFAIAVESTKKALSDELLIDRYRYIRKKQPDIIIVADVATYTEALRAYRNGADCVTTTFCRTYDRGGLCKNHNDHKKLVKKISNYKMSVPIIAEGGIHSPIEARDLLHAGADAVIVGQIITSPEYITNMFCNAINQYE